MDVLGPRPNTFRLMTDRIRINSMDDAHEYSWILCEYVCLFAPNGPLNSQSVLFESIFKLTTCFAAC